MTLHFKKEEYIFGDSFYIYDENFKRKYHVKSSIMLWKKKFEIFDLDKNLLVTIKNEPKSIIKKKYYIVINGQTKAAITKEPVSLLPKFTIEGLDWELHGAMRHEHEMLEHGKEIYSFHVESTEWGIRPILTINDSVDELLALAVAMTISYVTNAKEEGESSQHL